MVVTRKREDISLLIQSLMKEGGKDLNILPDVIFPTLNGELTERAILENDNRFVDPDEEDEMMDEEDDDDEEYLPEKQTKAIEKKCQEVKNSSGDNENGIVSSIVYEDESTLKPSSESVTGSGEDFVEQNVTDNSPLKPDVSELPKLQSSKDTLSYLKAKRILRHKNNISDGAPDNKKLKQDSDP